MSLSLPMGLARTADEPLTSRQVYAAVAMAALILADKNGVLTEERVAECAFTQADAMVAVEKREQ